MSTNIKKWTPVFWPCLSLENFSVLWAKPSIHFHMETVPQPYVVAPPGWASPPSVGGASLKRSETQSPTRPFHWSPFPNVLLSRQQINPLTSCLTVLLLLLLLSVQYAPLQCSSRSVWSGGPRAGPPGVEGGEDEGGAAGSLWGRSLLWRGLLPGAGEPGSAGSRPPHVDRWDRNIWAMTCVFVMKEKMQSTRFRFTDSTLLSWQHNAVQHLARGATQSIRSAMYWINTIYRQYTQYTKYWPV